MLKQGELVKVDIDLLFHKQAMTDAQSVLREYLAQHQQLTVAEFRDLIGSSRKYVVPMLEFFDRTKVTKRVGDQRMLA